MAGEQHGHSKRAKPKKGTSKVQENKKPQDGEPFHRSSSLDLAGREGQELRADEIRFSGKDSDRPKTGERSRGGILRQLKEAKEAHLRDVRAHAERLKLRLADDEDKEQSLLLEIASIEQELEKLDRE